MTRAKRCAGTTRSARLKSGKPPIFSTDRPRSAPQKREGIPASPYRRLIDATGQDVALVMVGGIAQAGDVRAMPSLKPGDFEVIRSQTGCFDKGIDFTAASVPSGSETLAEVSARLADGLRSLGGDQPPDAGGPSSPFANTWSYLKAHIPGASALSDYVQFQSRVLLRDDGRWKINLEAITPPPLFTVDDHWWFATLAAVRDAVTGLTLDPAPPYTPYDQTRIRTRRSEIRLPRRCFTTVGTAHSALHVERRSHTRSRFAMDEPKSAR